MRVGHPNPSQLAGQSRWWLLDPTFHSGTNMLLVSISFGATHIQDKEMSQCSLEILLKQTNKQKHLMIPRL